MGEGRLYSADAQLNRIEDIYYPIIKVLRSQPDGNWEYLRNGEIKIIEGSSGAELLRVPLKDFLAHSNILLTKIKNSSGAFEVPEIQEFLQKINCKSLKEGIS